ncbi:NAD-dependent epimerase/dehydratase family protein [Brevundimonas sp. UBA5936]|uniref:NAD-dependent epimerase/dehydratase family protein n=1 Tax=Brevundimonas sp. UBA5936 TaxID=1946133 RepID=UPI0025C43023|nr:NAD-dependent epimerase/dehydratase family protein [Brevundimonas sp. UBA5936]
MPSALDRVGIVGASGYVGGALAQALVADGGSPRLFGRCAGRVAGLEVRALTSDSSQFAGLDCVVHLSGITTSRASSDDLRRANVELALHTARMAAAAKVTRFVFTSSLHVHGKSSKAAIRPETPTNPAANPYGRSKSEAERELTKLADETGLELAILRPPMIYGSGSKGSFPLLVRLVRTGLPLPFATARAKRSFCSIDNLVSAIRHSIAAPAPVEVFLPADPEDFDTATLVREVAAALDRKMLLYPAPKALLAAPLGMIGRGEMVASLFDPLQIDRTHWGRLGWQPVETGAQAIRKAVRSR